MKRRMKLMVLENQYFELMKKSPELFKNPDIEDSENAIQILTDKEDIRRVEKKLEEKQIKGNKIGVIYEDEYITILRDAVQFPNGEEGAYTRFFNTSSKYGIVILLVYENEKKKKEILLERHFRHGIRDFSLEVPRGFSEKNLSYEENAEKELLEETSLIPTDIKYIGKVFTDTSISGNTVLYYYAEISDISKLRCNDKKEGISGFVLVSSEIFGEMTKTGQIADGYSIIAFSLAKMHGLL